jgi:hypothetical protein
MQGSHCELSRSVRKLHTFVTLTQSNIATQILKLSPHIQRFPHKDLLNLMLSQPALSKNSRYCYELTYRYCNLLLTFSVFTRTYARPHYDGVAAHRIFVWLVLQVDMQWQQSKTETLLANLIFILHV